MRKMLACFLALLMCCTGLTAFAESLTLPEVLPKSYFLEAAQQDYPDWQIRRASYYISGRYEGESARYIEISIYRITDSAIELLELSTLINPIREGDDVSWSVSALIPVEIVSGAADDLCAMTAEEIFYDGIGASFTNAARNLLVPSLRAADESVTQLLSCSKFLFCITENSAGKSILRIAEWDGSSYANVVATRPQPHLNFLPAHSYDGEMELWLSEDAVVYPRYDAEVGWHINHFFINDSNLVVFQNRIIEGEIEEWYQDNNSEHYGRLTLPHSLTEVDFATFPQTLDEVLAYMDYTDVACTAHDGTSLYAARMATCWRTATRACRWWSSAKAATGAKCSLAVTRTGCAAGCARRIWRSARTRRTWSAPSPRMRKLIGRRRRCPSAARCFPWRKAAHGG